MEDDRVRSFYFDRTMQTSSGKNICVKKSKMDKNFEFKSFAEIGLRKFLGVDMSTKIKAWKSN